MTVLALADRRISLADASALPPASPVFEVAFVGCCPAGQLDARAQRAVIELGFTPTTDGFDQPVPIDDWGTFRALFGATPVPASHDPLPGESMWLPQAVADFFAAGGRRAWVIRTAANADLSAYVPDDAPVPGFGAAPRGIVAAATIPTVGLVVLPDLERLAAVPEAVTPLPPPLPPIAPEFRPLGAPPPDRPIPGAAGGIAAGAPPLFLADLLGRICRTLARLRPDMQCLFSLPVGLDQTASPHALADTAIRLLYGAPATVMDRPGLQVLAPLLHDNAGAVLTPSGMVAGAIAAAAERVGPWQSIGGQVLTGARAPLRQIGEEVAAALTAQGVGILQRDPAGITLNDEVLAMPRTPSAGAAGTQRFIGWLGRTLRQFGEQLVFEVGLADDGRVGLALNGFFATLFQRGALRGRRLADAVSIQPAAAPEGSVAYEIGFAPSFAIETIRLRFVQAAGGTTVQAVAT
jgi:hypothetical protein